MEITESDVLKEREMQIIFLKISFGIALLLFVSFFFSVSNPVLNLLLVFLKIIGVLVVTVIIISLIQELKIPDLSAIKLYFREGDVRSFYKLERLSLFSNVFLETEVRFNQAIGFRVVAENHVVHPTLLWILKNMLREEEEYFYGYVVEIIYDPRTDGIPIIRSQYAEAIVQFLKMMEQIFPKMTTRQFYSVTKRNHSDDVSFLSYEEMDQEEADEFHKEAVPLPNEFREFIKEKYKIL